MQLPLHDGRCVGGTEYLLREMFKNWLWGMFSLHCLAGM